MGMTGKEITETQVLSSVLGKAKRSESDTD